MDLEVVVGTGSGPVIVVQETVLTVDQDTETKVVDVVLEEGMMEKIMVVGT